MVHWQLSAALLGYVPCPYSPTSSYAGLEMNICMSANIIHLLFGHGEGLVCPLTQVSRGHLDAQVRSSSSPPLGVRCFHFGRRGRLLLRPLQLLRLVMWFRSTQCGYHVPALAKRARSVESSTTCAKVQRKTSTCSMLEAKRSRAHEEAGQRRRVGGVTRRSEPHSPSVAPAP